MPMTTQRELFAPESGLVRIPTCDVLPSPENERLYRPVDPDDPEVEALADSIRERGLLEPLVITSDFYILSGHRRHAACRLAGVESVRCRVLPVRRGDPEFLPLLREYNRQRVKTFDEVVREEIVSASVDTEQAYQALLTHRRKASRVAGEFIAIGGAKRRAAFSEGKRAMLNAVIKVVFDQCDYWPLSDRSVHYDLLNDPPLRHTSKPDSQYVNDRDCYKDLTDVLTRARLAGLVPWEAIADPTRTVALCPVNRDVGSYLASELKGFLATYWRDLQQSQPNHIEIIGEKNTVEGSIKPVAERYCIPYTLGRGYCSIDPRHQMHERFRKSGRSKLVILVLSDFDPEGEDIAHSFVRSMRDDFRIHSGSIVAKKVCLTYQQVLERDLPQTFDIKKDGARYKKHAAKYGDRAHELEALSNQERSALLDEAIREVMDVEAFNREVDAEREDAARLERCRKAIAPAIEAALRETT
jgi:hypothetical protein